jgi:hypothetical protein
MVNLRVLEIFAWAYMCHLGPIILISVPTWIFGRRRAHWIWQDFILVIIPFVVWAVLVVIYGLNKGLMNIILEPTILGCLIAVGSIIRVIISDKKHEKTVATIVLILLCVMSGLLWLCVPGLPE